MGLLDDAIRQHLDLKRQHGADESELRRKENEALGPARREAPAPDEGEEAPVEEAAVGPEEAPVAPEEALAPVDDPGASPAEEELAESEELAEEDFIADEPPPDTYLEPEEPFALEDDLEPGPEPAPPAEPGPEGDGEDVLEETPDFLQETPEHDKLWFEQKPPRDFDFDDDEK